MLAELRLAGITTLEQANAFLPAYLERYRRRFGVPPVSSKSAYVPLSRGTDLDRLFCCKYTRKVANDNTIRFAGQVLQLLPGVDRLSFARAVVEVHQRLDGSLAVVFQGTLLLHVPAPADAPPPTDTSMDRLVGQPHGSSTAAAIPRGRVEGWRGGR